MGTERLKKSPEQVRSGLKKALVPIVGSPEAAENWVEGISHLAVVTGGRATIIPAQSREVSILRIVFPGGGENGVLVTLRPLSGRNKEK